MATAMLKIDLFFKAYIVVPFDSNYKKVIMKAGTVYFLSMTTRGNFIDKQVKQI
jgi:hypothetical protein